jgi:hypothetical protein
MLPPLTFPASATTTLLRGFSLFGLLTNRPQGLTCSTDNTLYVSFSNRLVATKIADVSSDVGASNGAPIFGVYDHVGDITFYDGVVIAPLEAVDGGMTGTGAKAPGKIAEYAASSLKYNGVDALTEQASFPWVAASSDGVLFSSEYGDVNQLFRYDISDNYAPLPPLALNATLDRTQGGAFYGEDYLYISTDTAGLDVWAVNVNTGEVSHAVSALAYGTESNDQSEMEGIAICETDEGVVMLMLLSDFTYFIICFCAIGSAVGITIATLLLAWLHGVFALCSSSPAASSAAHAKMDSPPRGEGDRVRFVVEPRSPSFSASSNCRTHMLQVFAVINFGILAGLLVSFVLCGEVIERGRLIQFKMTSNE